MSVKTEMISGFITLGTYDYVDVELLDDTFKFMVYEFDSSTQTYSKCILNSDFINHGTIRLSDSDAVYVIRVGLVNQDEIYNLTTENVRNAISIVYGNYNSRDQIVSEGQKEGLCVYYDSDVAFLEHRIATATGYEASQNNAVSAPISMLGFDGIRITFSSTSFRYAVYTVNDAGTYAIVSGGWLNAPSVFECTDSSVRYIIRVGSLTGNAFTQAEFDAAVAAVKVEHYYSIINVTWSYGSVSTGGVDTSVTNNVISSAVVLGSVDYDYLDVTLLNDTYQFAVYAYNPSTGVYSLAKPCAGYIKHGTVRVSDKNLWYIVRVALVDPSDMSLLTPAKVRKAISLSVGEYTTREEISNDGVEELGNVYYEYNIAYLEHTIDSASGYKTAYNNAVSAPISLLGFDGIRITFSSTTFRYAVYTVNDAGTYAIVSGGWLNAPSVFECTDSSVRYIIRVGGLTGDAFTQAEFDAAVAAVKVEYYYSRLNATWSYGSVSTGGLDTSKTDNVISSAIVLEDFDYDYLDITLLNDTYQFAVYAYNPSTGVYSLAKPCAGYIKHGTVRVSDKNFWYIVRVALVDISDMSLLTPENIAQSIGFSFGEYVSRAEASKAGTEEDGKIYIEEDFAYLEHSIDSTNGYTTSAYNIVSAPMSLNEFDGMRISLTGSTFKYAVYTVNDAGMYANISGGWLTSANVFECTDNSVRYIVRMAKSVTGDVFTQAEFNDAIAAVKVEYYYSRIITATGYTRTYNDITSTLTFRNQQISAGAIVSNNNTLLVEIPNSGNVEVRMNAPLYNFRVFSFDGSTYTELTSGASHYTYRYVGNSSLQYFVQIMNEGGGSIATTKGTEAIKCYTYVDAAVEKTANSNLYGKNIAVIGDSIVQSRYSNGSTMVGVAEKPWSHVVSESCNTESANFGIGGALVANTDWKSLYTNCENVVGFDVVFICAGTNDYGNHTSEATFIEAFKHVVEVLMANNVEVVVCTPVYRTNRTSANNVGLTLLDYVEIEKEIAEDYGLKVIDLYSLTNNADFTSTLTDGLHPTQAGQNIIADLVIQNY